MTQELECANGETGHATNVEPRRVMEMDLVDASTLVVHWTPALSKKLAQSQEKAD